MKAKEYLLQARYLEQRIGAKMQDIRRMNDLATNMTAMISDMPKAAGGSTSRMEEAVVKIVDYENEVQEDINRLVLLKKEIEDTIARIPEADYQLILHKRYMEMSPWEDIAQDVSKSVRWVQVIHGRALERLQEILEKRKAEIDGH